MPTHQQKHQAGRHLAVAEALLQGYAAHILGPQSYIEVNGHRAVVMVAAQGAWMIADVDQWTAAAIEAYVLVDIAQSPPVFYVAPGGRLREEVRERHDGYMNRVGTRPRNPDSKHSKIDPSDLDHWKAQWSLFD